MADRARLRDALTRVHEDELVALTRDLVRIPSVFKPGHPDGTEAAVAEHVHRWFLKEGFDVETDLAAPGRPNVIGWLGEGKGRTLLLEGHTDVVTEGDPAAWARPPFGGEVDGGRIWGRGTADMKGGLAAAMIAAAALKRSGARLGGRLVVGALVDEEADMLGVRRFAASPPSGWPGLNTLGMRTRSRVSATSSSSWTCVSASRRRARSATPGILIRAETTGSRRRGG